MTSTSASPVRQTPTLLIVEDSDEDFETFVQFLRRSPLVIPIERCVNGEQALAFLYHTGRYANPECAPRPGIILLDLIFAWNRWAGSVAPIKLDDNRKTIPVVVFTTSNNPKDIETCYQQGVNSYIIKPIDFNQLKQNVQTILVYWFEVTKLPNSSAG